MKIINKQKLIAILITGIILVNISGCGSKVSTLTEVPSSTVSSPITNPNVQTKQISESNSNSINNVSTEDKQAQTKQVSANAISKDDEVVNYFKKLKESVGKYVNEENIDKAKVKIDDVFITTVDFIFYDKKVNGVTFSSLSDGAKKQILETAKDINNIIIKKYPDYQIILKGKSQKIGKFISGKLEDTKEVIKEKIGEDKYNDISDGYKETKEKASDIKDKTLSKIKNWYEKKKNSN